MHLNIMYDIRKFTWGHFSTSSALWHFADIETSPQWHFQSLTCQERKWSKLPPLLICARACTCASMSLRNPPYEPPSVSELQEFLLANRHPTGHVNQVWPNLYIGNEYVHTTTLTPMPIYPILIQIWLYDRVAGWQLGTRALSTVWALLTL